MARGILFDIQHYAVHDGPGIRTLVFLKGCPLRCVWCCNPESQSPRPQLKHAEALCRRCLRCRAACPVRPEPAEELPRPGSKTRAICAECSTWACVEACPHGALSRVGETLEASEVVAQVAKDLAFYRNSGGGVTFSGGEPLSQPDFLADMLEQCRSQHIHTAVETCGAARPEAMAAVADLVDLFLYDVKIVDPSRHRALTGAENTLILENLRSLAARSAEKIVIRVPLVPGCTDSSENLQAIARLAVEIGVGRVWLLPYHNLGAGKYGELGIVCPCDAAPLSADALERAAGLFGEQGLKHEV